MSSSKAKKEASQIERNSRELVKLGDPERENLEKGRS